MKVLKKFRKNVTTSPKSTEKGLLRSIFIVILGAVAVEVGKRNETVGLLIQEHQEEIYGLLVMIVSWVIHKFGAKEDD